MHTGVAFSPTGVSLDGAFTAWQTLTVGWGKIIGSNAPILTGGRTGQGAHPSSQGPQIRLA